MNIVKPSQRSDKRDYFELDIMVKSVQYRQFTNEEEGENFGEMQNQFGEIISTTPCGPPPNFNPINHIELSSIKKHVDDKVNGGGDDEDADDELSWYIENYEANPVEVKFNFQDVIDQFIIIFHLGAPNCIEKFSSFFPGFMLLVFYGQVGPDEISGAGFGFMYGNGK